MVSKKDKETVSAAYAHTAWDVIREQRLGIQFTEETIWKEFLRLKGFAIDYAGCITKYDYLQREKEINKEIKAGNLRRNPIRRIKKTEEKTQG